ncbi:MAG: hypothetical protein JWN82_120 [Candidatus Saccharibacteria bacterium]|nr:hypothetical protein [Candidatus Saccharibacteria bacterium]
MPKDIWYSKLMTAHAELDDLGSDLAAQIDGRFSQLEGDIGAGVDERTTRADTAFRRLYTSVATIREGDSWENNVRFKLQYGLGHTTLEQLFPELAY